MPADRPNEHSEREMIELAEKIRQVCVDAARDGFREASVSGLCSEGASEAAVSAIQNLRLEEVIGKLTEETGRNKCQ